MVPLSTVAKAVQRIYGSINQAAAFTFFEKRTVVKRIAASRKNISKNAHPGDFNPKKS